MEAELSPHEVASRLFAALRERDLGLIRTLDHPDVVRDFVAIAEFRGVDACQEFYTEMLAAFPDFDIEVERIVRDGDDVVAQWLATGTFSGRPSEECTRRGAGSSFADARSCTSTRAG